MESETLKERIVHGFCDLSSLLALLAAESAAGIQQHFRDDDLEGAQAAFRSAEYSASASKQIEQILKDWRKQVHPVQGQPQAVLDKTVKQLVREAYSAASITVRPPKELSKPGKCSSTVSVREAEEFILELLYNSKSGEMTSEAVNREYKARFRGSFNEFELSLNSRGDCMNWSRWLTSRLCQMKDTGDIEKPGRYIIAITDKGRERIERDVIGE